MGSPPDISHWHSQVIHFNRRRKELLSAIPEGTENGLCSSEGSPGAVQLQSAAPPAMRASKLRGGQLERGTEQGARTEFAQECQEQGIGGIEAEMDELTGTPPHGLEEESSAEATEGSVKATERSVEAVEGSMEAAEGSVKATEGSVKATEGSVGSVEDMEGNVEAEQTILLPVTKTVPRAQHVYGGRGRRAPEENGTALEGGIQCMEEIANPLAVPASNRATVELDPQRRCFGDAENGAPFGQFWGELEETGAAPEESIRRIYPWGEEEQCEHRIYPWGEEEGLGFPAELVLPSFPVPSDDAERSCDRPSCQQGCSLQ